MVLPSVFAKVGMLGGIAGMTFCAVLNMYILTLQVDAKVKTGRPIFSYIELARSSLTPPQV